MEYQSLNSDKNEIRVLTLFPSHHSGNGPNNAVCCTMENVPLEPLTRKYNLRANPVQGSFGCYWEDKFAGKAKPASSLAMTALDEDENDVLGLEEEKRPFKGRYPWGEYVALSYVWSDPNKTREILVNGKSVQVTENLESALRILRDKLPMRLGVRLWVDALCINQKDAKERSAQVARMWGIYGNALEVVVWLGEEAEDTWKAVRLIKILSLSWKKDKGKELGTILATNPNFPLASYQMSGARCGRRQERDRRLQKRERRYHLRSAGPPEPSLFGCWHALQSLMQREYWNRVWVLQELSAGTKETPILCGRSVVSLEDLFNAAIKWIYRMSIDLVFTLLAREKLSDQEIITRSKFDAAVKCATLECGDITTGNLQLAMKFHDMRQKGGWPHPLDVLGDGRKLDATDPRDKIYGFMALIDPYFVNDLKPNYELPVEQVYADFCIALMQAYQSLDFVLHCNWTPDKNTIPSWVPDWNLKPDIAIPFLPASGKARYHYFAGGPGFSEYRMRLFPVPSPDKRRLKTICLMTDQIDGLSMNPWLDDFDAQPTQPVIQNNHYGDFEACREALWRTFLCNRVSGSIIPQSGDKDAIAILDFPLPQDHLTLTKAEKLFYTFITLNRRFRVAGRPLGQYFTRRMPQCESDIKQRTKLNSREVSFRENACANTNKARLFTTHMGLVGICPPSVKSTDLVSVLLGCSVPLVLRPCEDYEDHFMVIGACYAHGIMEGEVLDLLVESRKINPNNIQHIILC